MSKTLESEIVKLAEAEKRSNKAVELVDKVFGHPSVTVSTYKDVVTPVDGGGNGMSGFAQRDSLTETTTTTESKV